MTIFHYIDKLIDRPEAIRAFEDRYNNLMAIMVIDMVEFSKTAETDGIVSALIKIRQMHRIAEPLIHSHRGRIVKYDADNIFVLFDNVPAATLAANDIISSIRCSIGIGYGVVLDFGNDCYGVELNRASRLGEDVAKEGEILFTDAALAACQDTNQP